jgi:hypothetical protein
MSDSHVKRKKDDGRAVSAGGATTRFGRAVKCALYCRAEAAGGAILQESAACRTGP